jgi:hypothetical protein
LLIEIEHIAVPQDRSRWNQLRFAGKERPEMGAVEAQSRHGVEHNDDRDFCLIKRRPYLQPIGTLDSIARLS